MKKLAAFGFILAVVLLVHVPVTGQRFTIEAGAAPTVAAGEDIRELAAGYTLAIDGALALTRNVEVGLRYSFSDWAPVRDAFLGTLSATTRLVDVDGGVWSMEIAPFFRLDTDFEENVVNLFAQVGAGLYIIDREFAIDLIVNGEPVEQQRDEGTNAHFGFSLGAGTTIGRAKPVLIRTYPAWNYVIRDQTPDQYWSFNILLAFGFGTRR
ncbi:MAG: hypothetical protein GF363_13865 [Chitinivibrionales bacterium]|nr:hypothetical protein [Chitinivibrionales bacterium]